MIIAVCLSRQIHVDTRTIKNTDLIIPFIIDQTMYLYTQVESRGHIRYNIIHVVRKQYGLGSGIRQYRKQRLPQST